LQIRSDVFYSGYNAAYGDSGDTVTVICAVYWFPGA